MNEYTSPQAFAGLHELGRKVAMPGKNVATVSHNIPTHPDAHRVIQDPASALQARNLKQNCEHHNIPLFDTNDQLQGVEHIIAPGHRVIRPGGSAIDNLSIEARFTLCNMAVEAGARGALIAPDEKAIEYVFARASDMTEEHREGALKYWATLRSDKDAEFEIEHKFDAREVVPYVTWGTSPDQAIPITGKVPAAEGPQSGSLQKAMDYTGLAEGSELEGLAVQHVFIGSCTNGRIEDLREVAAVVKGQKVSPSVRAMVVPGSGAVRDQAESEGIAQILIDAGFEWRKPGCSMCLAMNDDVLEPSIRCASSTNRNFEGRQGRGAITHLMSPAMAAAAAVTGHITDVRKLGDFND